jgi:hypothetical protein
MITFFVIVTGYTGTGKPKFLTEGDDWADSLAAAKRFTTYEDADKQLLPAASKKTGGNVYRIEKVITF